MKGIGIIILAICPIMTGFAYSINLSKLKNTILKIIELLNWLIVELRYKKTETLVMIDEACKNSQFKSLIFLDGVKKLTDKAMPFPTAWKTATENWNSEISIEDREYLKSIGFILGSSDSEGQITSLNHLKAKFEDSFKKTKTLTESKGKLAKTLGILLGIAIYIVMI